MQKLEGRASWAEGGKGLEAKAECLLEIVSVTGK